MSLLFLTLTSVLIGAHPIDLQQSLLPAIREMIRTQGHAEVWVNAEYPPVDLDELTGSAEVIAEVVTGPSRSYLTKDESRVFTDYTMTIVKVLKGVANQGGTITIRRTGGVLTVDNAPVVVHQSHFPAFQVGERYILFLGVQDGSYYVRYGPAGAFRVSDGRVRQVLEAQWNEEHAGMSVDDFRQLVRSKMR